MKGMAGMPVTGPICLRVRPQCTHVLGVQFAYLLDTWTETYINYT